MHREVLDLLDLPVVPVVLDNFQEPQFVVEHQVALDTHQEHQVAAAEPQVVVDCSYIASLFLKLSLFVRNYVVFSQTSYDPKAPRFSNKSVPEKDRTMFSVVSLIFSHSIRALTEKNSDQFLFVMSPNTIHDVSSVQRSPHDEPKLSPIKSLKFSDPSLRSRKTPVDNPENSILRLPKIVLKC